MRKNLCFILMLIMVVFAFSSCGANEFQQKDKGIKNNPVRSKTGEDNINHMQYLENNNTNDTKLPENDVQKAPGKRYANKNVMLAGIEVGGLEESEIISKIKKLSQDVNVEVRNAKLSKNTWALAQTEKTGKRVNVEKTLERVLNAKEGKKVKLAVEKVKPSATARRLKRNVVRIGSFTTFISDKKASRINNMEVAAKNIMYEKVAPGEEFSFNQVLGRRTPGKGYERAPIIIKTENGPKKDYGVGGGICQLSTTLYNAADRAGLKVTERHAHSKRVGYVPEGRDATVTYGGADLKFVNTGKHPVMIKVYVSNYRVKVSIIENRNQ